MATSNTVPGRASLVSPLFNVTHNDTCMWVSIYCAQCDGDAGLNIQVLTTEEQHYVFHKKGFKAEYESKRKINISTESLRVGFLPDITQGTLYIRDVILTNGEACSTPGMYI